MVGAVLHGTALAQQPPPRPTPARVDTARARRAAQDSAKARAAADSIARRRALTDTLRAKGDTLRQTSDSAKATGDTLKLRPDTLRGRPDTLKATRDTLKAARDSLARAAEGDTLRTRADSIAADSLERENRRILAEQRRRADTVKAPTPAAEMPLLTDMDGGYRWGRDELAATAALTLGDLLEGVPGFTVFRAGWIGAPQVGAMIGDLQRLRIFYDGIELDAIDPRNGGMHDLSFIQLWHLEEVRIERGASELRVHLRSWRVRSMTPATRVDIGSGDLETNGYRGYFGRRFGNGAALQLGANQMGTRDNRGAGDADGLSLFGRVGWARGPLSADASFTRSARDRTEQLREEPFDALPAFDGASSEGYVRLAYRDTTRGLWTQLTAAQISHSQNNLAFVDSVPVPFRPIPSELSVTRQQYIAAGGWGRGPLEVSVTARVRRLDDVNYVSPTIRLGFDTPKLTVAGFAEQQPELNLRRLEVSGRVLPLSWLAVSGAVSQFAPSQVGLFPSSLTYRGEVGVRVHRAWLAVGLMSRDSARLVAPIVFDTTFSAGATGPVSGLFVSLRGKIWKDVGFDATAMKWDSAGAYLPAYQTRTQLYVNTGWLSRFPSGNFNVLFALTHEYRTRAVFPVGETALESSQYRTINAQLEIRLLQATLTYQFRNLLNEQYQQVPGYFMHRPVQYYGVRWNFFN